MTIDGRSQIGNQTRRNGLKYCAELKLVTNNVRLLMREDAPNLARVLPIMLGTEDMVATDTDDVS